MIHTKKWMVVPYESDDELKYCNDKNKEKVNQLKSFVKNEINVEKTVDFPKNQHLDKINSEDINDQKEIIDDIVEKGKINEENNFKETIVQRNKKFNLDDVLQKMTESYYQRNPSENTRKQTMKRLQNKRKLERSLLVNQSRLNSDTLVDQSISKRKKKRIRRDISEKKNIKKLNANAATKIKDFFGNSILFSRLDDDDIEINEEEAINNENINFGNISAI